MKVKNQMIIISKKGSQLTIMIRTRSYKKIKDKKILLANKATNIAKPILSIFDKVKIG
jgi:hypothetical protein